jgi:Tat protein secretion system quality control protein TatD with DNase activity
MSTLVDSHCHLDFPDFAADLDAIVERAEAAQVARMCRFPRVASQCGVCSKKTPTCKLQSRALRQR